MRVFLCSFDDYSIAIPMDSIASLSLFTGDSIHNKVSNASSTASSTTSSIEYNHDQQCIYISLFCLFNLQPKAASHGIALKKKIDNNTVILLTAPVESETEIQADLIFPVPGVLNTMSFASFFTGIQFFSNSKPLLIMNIDRLIQYIIKEKS